ncbi:MAG: NAD(P)H-binding protein [Bryobacterales bacterium]
MSDRAVILGATGPTGFHLAAALRRRGRPVRVVSRRRETLERLFGESGEEIVEADALDASRLDAALEGAGVVFDCIGLPAERMQEHAATARSLVAAASATGARIVQVSSFWPYLPFQSDVLTEDHPREGGPDWARYRREAEDILQEAGGAILNLPDFYGPHVHTSLLQQPLEEALAHKAMNWLGDAKTEREHVYVPDAMEVAARVAERDEAYGQRWILPGGGPLSGEAFRQIVSQALDREVQLRAAGLWTLRAVGLFNAQLKAFLPMVPRVSEADSVRRLEAARPAGRCRGDALRTRRARNARLAGTASEWDRP